MVAYLYRMPTGIPGEISRTVNLVAEPNTLTAAGQADAPDAYGIPVVIDSTTGNIRKVKASDTGIYGFLMRPFPGHGTTPADLGTSVPPGRAGSACDVMRKGYMTVKLAAGTAVKGNPVYIWDAAASGAHFPGSIEAADPTTSGFVINATFMGGADANGNVEIAFNI